MSSETAISVDRDHSSKQPCSPADVPTTLEIYPHNQTAFHYFMGVSTGLLYYPVTLVLLPSMVAVRLVVHTLFRLLVKPWAGPGTLRAIGSVANRLLLPVHWIVYKVFYTYLAIWLGCFDRFREHWFGIALSPYKDYADYLARFRDGRVRWRYKKKLKDYAAAGIEEERVEDHDVFFTVLFSGEIFELIKDASQRKNGDAGLVFVLAMLIRDYFILLFLPVRMHLFRQEGKIVGLATYLRRGDTMVMCQHLISSSHTTGGMFYRHMELCIRYAFAAEGVRYVSCAFSSQQSKETCGCHPIDFLAIDEFRFMPFSVMDVPLVNAASAASAQA